MKSKTVDDLFTYLDHTAPDMLLKAYRALALDVGYRDRDPYSYFNQEMRALDTLAKRIGITGIEPARAHHHYNEDTGVEEEEEESEKGKNDR